MKPRTSLVAGLAATLALAGPSRAADPQPNAIEDQPPAQDRAPSVDITGRLRTTPNGLSLEIGGTLVELQMSDGQVPGGESPGRGDEGAHDFRASFSVDGHATNLLLRVVPPPSETAAPPK